MDFKTWRNVNHREVAHIPNLFEKTSLEKTVSYIKQNIKSTVNTGQKTQDDQDKKYVDRRSWKVDNSHSFCKEFLDTLNNFIVKANNKHFQFDLDKIDGPYYVEYPQDGRTKLDWHLDIGEYPYNQRKLSFSLLVSDPSEYEGGNLEIWRNNNDYINLPKTPGSITFFPSFLPHRVTPITKGVRRNFIGFVMGRPYR